MKELVAKIIFSSLQNLFRDQRDLSKFIPQHTSEREPNLSFHLANELWKYIFWLNCDFDVIKTCEALKRPDLVFHKRNSKHLNFLVVEVKRNTFEVEEDLVKIKNHWFGDALKYQFGASVLIDVDNKTFQIVLLERNGDGNRETINEGRTEMSLPLPTQRISQQRESLKALVQRIADEGSDTLRNSLKYELAGSVKRIYEGAETTSQIILD